MATAHLIHGFIGAGKTTLAKRLEAELPAIRFTHDEWMAALYGSDPPAERFGEYYRRVSGVMEGVWVRCLELGLDVVLDFGLWTRRDRDTLRARVASVGAETRLYALGGTDEELWARVERRNQELESGLFIARNTFEVLRGRFEPLGADEIAIKM